MATLKERFEILDSKRGGLLKIAEECSNLTLRYIFPPPGTDSNTYLGKPWQSVGSRGVNNLAAKLLLTLLPTDGGFFRYSLDQSIKASLEPEVVREIENLLAISEEITLQELNKLTVRHTLFEALKHLIITGNVALWYDMKSSKLKLYSLRDYVVVRDKAMNLVEVILKETVDKDALPSKIRAFVEANNITSKEDTDDNISADADNPTVTVYTGAKLINGNWEIWQEIEDMEVDGSRHNPQRLPIFVLRWTNGIYGRGLVEQILGDLNTLEVLTKAVTKGSMAAAKTVFLVNPTGMTKASKIAKAKTGDVVEGNPNDVGVLQMNKYADFRVAQERIALIEDRLNQIFLIFQPRNAERVTAEEIRRLTEELEALLGGVYTLLSEELQKPLIETVFDSLQRQGKVPKMPREDVNIIITTGFEALSRTTILNKLMLLLNAVGAIPNAVEYIHWDEYLARILNSLNINPKGLVKTQAELQQEQQAMMQQQIAMQTAAQQAQTQGNQ